MTNTALNDSESSIEDEKKESRLSGVAGILSIVCLAFHSQRNLFLVSFALSHFSAIPVSTPSRLPEGMHVSGWICYSIFSQSPFFFPTCVTSGFTGERVQWAGVASWKPVYIILLKPIVGMSWCLHRGSASTPDIRTWRCYRLKLHPWGLSEKGAFLLQQKTK